MGSHNVDEMAGTQFSIEVQPIVPERIARLKELANDLLYSWDREVRRLFFRLDSRLWEQCRHNPKVFLRRVSQRRLEEAEKDRDACHDDEFGEHTGGGSCSGTCGTGR